eukprot:TRINITY_DN12344_c0_g1_i1.p1 TRINITY_DN12344_c0_g1~~TRINITY_DN12344_c0_g1_i1.p1  ORF type:complete len:140 (-),score=35.25 TRINITY_DN12344_c0_g1_i1:43-462(-)
MGLLHPGVLNPVIEVALSIRPHTLCSKPQCPHLFGGPMALDLEYALPLRTPRRHGARAWSSDDLTFAVADSTVVVGVGVIRELSPASLVLARGGHRCLLYTSDAADDLLCVDLGGRRIIKKKKKKDLGSLVYSFTKDYH